MGQKARETGDLKVEEARVKALAEGLKTYIGRVCAKDEEHGDERYASNGGCVVCVTERARAQTVARPRKKALMSETEVQALLLRGGPMNKAQAEAAGLKWFNSSTGDTLCGHMIIGLDGYCPLCGQPTPSADDKDTLDLAAQLLS